MTMSRGRRVMFCSIAAAAMVGVVAAPAGALDPGANSSAFGISATVLSGAVNVPPTPTSTFPPGGTTHLASVNLGTLGAVGAVNATTAGNSAAGTSSATGSAANVGLLRNALTAFPAISADLVSATCRDAAPAAPVGSSTFTNVSISGKALLNVNPSPNTKLLNLPGVLVVTLNEQHTRANGVFEVNAIHVELGPIVNNKGTLADVIIGQATCGPNAQTAPGAAFSFQDLPVILGGLALLIALGFGVRAGVRRLHHAA